MNDCIACKVYRQIAIYERKVQSCTDELERLNCVVSKYGWESLYETADWAAETKWLVRKIRAIKIKKICFTKMVSDLQSILTDE